MFLFSMDYSILNHVRKNEAMTDVWKKCKICHENGNFRYIVHFVGHLDWMIFMIGECDAKLWEMLSNYTSIIKKDNVDKILDLWNRIDLLHQDLFDVLFYFIVFSHELVTDNQHYMIHISTRLYWYGYCTCLFTNYHEPACALPTTCMMIYSNILNNPNKLQLQLTQI